jgi:hypothetical protein
LPFGLRLEFFPLIGQELPPPARNGYRELTDALTEVLAENAVGPARRGRLARARAAVKKHPEYSEHAYF